MQLLLPILCVGCSFVVQSLMAKAVHPARVFNESSYPSNHMPIEKGLQQVFGISAESHRHRQLLSPPQYMLRLYAAVADNSGVVKEPNPYGAKIIRSYTEKDLGRKNYFTFSISGVEKTETLLEAELHFYMLKSDVTMLREVRVYQILDSHSTEQMEKTRLIDVQHFVNTSSEGWLIFRVKQAVHIHSFENPASNHLGFFVMAVSIMRQPALLHISRRRDRHTNRQPVLVLFNDDTSSTLSSQPDTRHDFSSAAGSRANRNHENGVLRQRRELVLTTHKQEPFEKTMAHRQREHHQRLHMAHTSECHRQELYVDFESIGWSEWIIAPKGYNAYHCTGICSFPLGQSQKPTNHATVQSIVHEMNLTKSVARPCCVPNRLLSLSLLYYDEHDNVVLKQYGEMVADSCGCH